jgi:hypothetical protein
MRRKVARQRRFARFMLRLAALLTVFLAIVALGGLALVDRVGAAFRLRGVPAAPVALGVARGFARRDEAPRVEPVRVVALTASRFVRAVFFSALVVLAPAARAAFA